MTRLQSAGGTHAAIDRLLDRQLDRLVFLTRRTAPEFYADYQASRRILGAPRRRQAEKVTEREETTTAAVALVAA